jgi:hypothetical protein
MYPAASSAAAEIAKIHYSGDYIGSNRRVKFDVFDVSVGPNCLCVQKRKMTRKKTVQKLSGKRRGLYWFWQEAVRNKKWGQGTVLELLRLAAGVRRGFPRS